MVTAEQIQNDYIDYVLTHNEQPKSVYIFAKNLQLSEQEFYTFYSSFDAIEKAVWADLTIKTINEVQAQEVWINYSSREKILAFFYAFIELLKTKRSFIIFTLKKYAGSMGTPAVLADTRNLFETFAENILRTGIESKELADRKFISKRYKDALWVQFGIIVNFWAKDSSTGFEKTDEAIEKGVNVTFDFFQRSALDNLIDYGKFISRNARFKEKMRF